jgi:hypothetical protein
MDQTLIVLLSSASSIVFALIVKSGYDRLTKRFHSPIVLAKRIKDVEEANTELASCQDSTNTVLQFMARQMGTQTNILRGILVIVGDAKPEALELLKSADSAQKEYNDFLSGRIA